MSTSVPRLRLLFAAWLAFAAAGCGAPPAAPVSAPEFEPGRIAFQSDQAGAYDLYVINADGSNILRLTDSDAQDAEPAWSPDGAQIAFTSSRGGRLGLYLLDLNLQAERAAVNSLAAPASRPAVEASPAWSPDGAQIAYVSNRDGDLEIYVLAVERAGESEGVNLTNHPANDQEPAWSPDGARLLFVSDRDGDNNEIYVMNADGSGQTNLTNSAANDTMPAWSPDGAQIAFASTRDGNFEIYVMNADGSGQRRLTNNQASDQAPAWSPDGQTIVFHSDRRGVFDLYAMDLDGGGVRQLTRGPGNARNPAWEFGRAPAPTPAP